MIPEKEAKARIKINKLLEDSGWFVGEDNYKCLMKRKGDFIPNFANVHELYLQL